MRLNRYLAWTGAASRRKADDLIRAGRVEVNGNTVTTVGISVNPQSDIVKVDGRKLSPPADQVFLFHKPAGYLVSRRGQGGKPTIFSLLPPELQVVQPVGRLDFDTDGALLLTNDGELSRRLQHPRYGIERVYLAAVRSAPQPDKVRQAKSGINLGDKTPARGTIRIVKPRGRNIIVEVHIHEGRKHEVKRLLGWAGAPVIQLSRLSFAGFHVGRLAPGTFRKLGKSETARLRRLVGLAD